MSNANIESVYRLSPVQEGMLFHTLNDREHAPYFEQMVLRHDQDIDPDLLRSVWQSLVDRHPILRTAFFWEEVEQPVQVVHRQAEVAFAGLDWSSHEPRERARRLEELLAEDRARGFALDRAPLMRLTAVRWDEGSWRIVWSFHHLLLDAWSTGLLLREAAALYQATAQGVQAALEARRPFGDYIAWLRQQDLSAAESYWRQTFEGLAGPTTLGIDRSPGRAIAPEDAHAESEVVLSEKATAALERFARRHRVTLYTLVEGVWALALARYGSTRDVVFGCTVSGRPAALPGSEAMIGCFINTLPVRVRIQPDQELVPWLRELQADQMELRHFEHSPLPDVQRWSGLAPGRSLFDAILVFENFVAQSRNDGSFEAIQRTNYPLTLIVWPRRELVLRARYYTGRFDEEGIRSLLSYIGDLLGTIAGDSAGAPPRLCDLPALPAAEVAQLALWNRTEAAWPLDRCLHELIEDQVGRSPEAVAAVSGEESITYRELSSRARGLAHHLRSLGIGPDVRVGVAMERSLDLVTALFGVLQAGGAYVPLDPSYPAERLAAMAEDAFGEIPRSVVLTQSHLLGRLPERLLAGGAQVIPLDSRREELARERAAPPAPATAPESLAYVIFTSGSTGRPKGAMNAHRGIVNRLLWMQDAYGLAESDRVLQKTPFSFDVSVWEFFWPLLTGARIVLAAPGGHQDPAYLARLISEQGVTVLHFVPSMLQAFLEEPGIEDLVSLRRVMASGEALPPSLVRRFFARLSPVELHNLYGPTEAAVDVTAWTCERDPAAVPIGRPVANTAIHLLDAGMEPVPVGVLGELHIAGVQVGRGYLGRPELTAERFIPAPLGERLYRTGDLARWRTDGTLEYLGRIDHQVKIRGFRIELGEIEVALSGHSGLREAVVVAREDEPGDRRLVAYWVPREPSRPSAEDLRLHLARTLPEHMVPQAFMALAALPLSPNGKVDRNALPAPEWRPAASARRIPPRNPTEQALAEIWGELLKVEQVGVEDDFFSLGGDSIKAVRLVSRANTRLAADLRVPDVFKHPTVASLALRLDAPSTGSLSAEHAAGMAEIEQTQRAVLADERQRRLLPEGWEDFFPLSGIEKGMIYYTLLLPDQPIYHDQYAYLLSIDDLDSFFHAFELLAGRHPVLRTSFHLDELTEPMKVVHDRAPVSREVEDLSDLSEEEQRRRIERYRRDDLHHRFTFAGELLWRLKVFKLRDGLYCTVLTWHHAIIDGWSNLSFWVELNQLYGRPDLRSLSSLPALASSYKDYLALTLGRRRSPATEAFWRGTLADAGRNRLPFQRARAREGTSFGMDAVDRRLDGALLAVLRTRSAELRVPFKAVFLAAHVHLLRAASGEQDIVTGVVSHDRPGLPDGDRIIGCFLNTVPLRLQTSPGETGRSLVRRVGDHLLAAREHEIPLADVAALVGARETAGNPFFDTLLNFMDFHLLEEAGDNTLFRTDGALAGGGVFDLTRYEMTNTLFDLEVSATLGTLVVHIKFSPPHFEPVDVERALVLYERILERLGHDLDTLLGVEMLLSPAERDQLVVAYNETASAFPHHRPLHAFFEEQAALRPGHTAVVCGDRSLTYGELDRQANRLARLLISRGVHTGDNVGVCLERSPELIAALLGVLKAGAAYVPLEPSYPPARRSYIARQSAVSLLLEELPEDLAAFPDAPVPVRPEPDGLAYTIYTSGSTGTPKGVMIAHHSAVNLIGWVNREMGIGSGDRVLMVSSVCFDLSVYDIFGTLAAGGTVVVARQEEVQDPAALLRLVAERKITFWNSVPSTLGLLVQYLEETDPDFRGEDLRLAFLSGDWIPLSLPERARRFFPNLRVISLGGATEATVWSIFHPVERIDQAWLSIPYGRPLDNNTFYILDRHLELVSRGVVGDLYIGGVGVARGYAGDSEKTASSYLPDPFGGAGARLYRTGDLGRMLPAGEIEFLGRSDHQVKIRGFRVELGEIESQLSRGPGVREAVVLARSDRSGQKYLCGYVVADDHVSIGLLREHLAGSLPGYMIPETFVFLPELPLTANGKIDRKALPEPEAANTSGDALLPPADATEAALVEIWQEVLGLSVIGTTQDFFALGGHSLSAIQVLTRVRRRFEIDLPLPAFFESPTVAGLAAAVERRRGIGASAPLLHPSPRPERLPLSFAQERLWFLDRLQPGNAAYNIPLALGLRGSLSVPALAASLSAVAARHEALRTTFAEVEGRPVQRIARILDLRPPVVDLEALPEGLRSGEARRLLGREAARPFDLERGPLVRVVLVQLSGGHHLALFNVHHIVADGWSMGVLVQEVGALYAALIRGGRPALPPLAIQYPDFAVWQRETWTAEALAGELAFWRERLAGAPPVLDLPFDRPRPAAQRFRGAQLSSLLPADRLAGLAAVQRRSGTTLFMVLLAAFQALLARLTGREDIVVGSPVAGRHQVETESLIGLFVNTLALRADLAGDPTFAELLARVREATVEAYAHDALPFERLVEELRPERSLSYAPVFQVVFALQNAPLEALELPGLTLEPAGLEVGSTKLDLSVSMTEAPQGLVGAWEHDRDLFDPTTVRRLQDRFALLLSGALADPSRRLSELPLLSASEHHQVVQEWNDTRPEATGGLPVPQRFAGQAACTPAASALEMRDRTVRYGELDRRADHIARRLIALGAGAGTVVGLCAERSPELVAGLLGVWKAGAAYLPLDPALPDARLAFLLEDARTGMGGDPLLLIQEPLAGRLAALAPVGARLVSLEEVAEIREEAGEPLPPRARSTDPAYLIYTSGTTGVPKAVVVEHRSLASVLDAAQLAFSFSAGDRMPCLAPFSFDISLFELLGMLLAGGTSVLHELRPTLDVRELAAGLGGMTRLHAVPALLRQIVEMARECGPYPGMRTVFVGGDAVPPDLLADLPSLFPRAEIHVLYGPTEATIICSHERVSGREAPENSWLPLGRPFECARLRLLDRHGRPVPIGVAGEIAIGGAGVARGYLKRPELTAEKFPVLDGERFYRSGDLARHRPDGRLEFLGRLDGQVKIRGFRIEPGEIEAALARHPAVREAVVAVREAGDRQLVAYAVPHAGEDVSRPSFPAELRAFLAERLPEHMVPTFVVPLAELPLSPHGKVDRKALPEPERTASAAPSTAPRTAFEEMLAEIWQDVLHLPAGSFGVHDSFFALGGHSLLATQVASRVRQLTGVEVPVRALFEQPTIAGLAPRIEQALQGGAAAGEPLTRQPREGFPPLSFTQERLWFLARLAPEDSAYNMPFQVRLRGVLDAVALGRSLAAVVRRHESLRTAFRLVDGRAVQVIVPPAAADGLAMPLADLSALPEAARTTAARRLALQEATRPFDLEAGPLLRALLVRLAPDEHLALLNTHHAVSDAWSTGVLFREVAALYPALRDGRPARLPELPVQYADFAIWQRRRLSGPTLAAQVAWWREHLGGDLPPLDLPTDRPRPPVQDHRGGSRTQTLAPELARSIAELGRREGATLFMVLLAAFQALLGRWSGQEDIVVGTPVAGRDRRETEGLIGLFLNTLALRTHVGGNPSFRALLGRVRETALGAYAHAELPFEKLVEELRPRRDLSRSPLFDVMLNVVNTPPVRAEIPGLELAFEEPANPGAKFSLTLYASERESRIDLHLVYQAALFTPERAAVILDQLAALLEQAVATPDRPIQSFSLVTAAPRALLPDPSLPLPVPRYETVPALVREQATRAPGAPAVRQGGRAWSYGELAERSLDLARVLAAVAERRGETVAVSGAPSFGLVAALLAVLQSGGVMLTLDPALPAARRRVMAREAGARRVVLVDAAATGEELLPELAAVLRVDPASGRLLAGGDRIQISPAIDAPPSPEDPAYVFFTSGSTGVPKGILGWHRGVSHFLAWQRETFRIGPGDRCAQLTALSFDALLRDVFLPLTSGATLCLPDAAGLPPAQIVPWLEREGITLIHTLPAVAQAWAGSLGRPAPLPALRWIFFSGEPLTDVLVRRLRQAFPGEAAMVNLYGPTETTMTKCSFVVPDEPVPGIQPLGHPLPETQALVLGPESRLCGIGEAGEIVLRTPFRTLGYLNAPEESWQRFVPNPFRDDPDDLLYRTGDRGRYRPDGSLEILGRLDEQVKVRGVRVEPGEVEAALLRHPSVAAAAVVARPDSSGELRLIAYVARAEGRTPLAGELREHLRRELPDPLLPAAFVILDALPLGPTGKVDRRALPAPEAQEPSRAGSAAPRTALERVVAEVWQEVLQLDSVGLHDNFFDLGGHSLRLVEVHSRLTSLAGGELPLVELFRHPTVSALARHLEQRSQGAAAPAPRTADRPREVREPESRAIAIVGMGGRFPGAPDLERFWRNLCDGVESITFFTDEELLASGIDPATLASPRYVRAGSVIDGIDRFDAAFFNFTPREAEILDPQHRLFLELSWEVLERAGYDPKRYPDPIGVYAGVHRSTYLLNLYSHPELVRSVGDGILKQTTDKDYLTTRVSYKLGLRGPSFTVQTTCSTSLVAVHIACQAVLAGECRMALAGGVSVRVPQEQGYVHEEGDILSPDGHCRPFDAEGRGTIFTNGLGLVLVKRLDDALADGDTIHAVIRGTAINNDGADKVGYTAPGIDGQAEVILAAQRAAGVDPDSITYVEAHGTATTLGDPIEIAALTRAFRDGGATRHGFCAIGSVKANIGHLDTAAGVAGLIKAALALEHGIIPPGLHGERSNPNIDFASSPFYLNHTLAEWRTDGAPRRAGVSSFGIGGTNAHAVLEEPPRREPSGPSRPWQLLLLSARTPSALEAATARLAEHLESHPGIALADAAFTLQVGRRVFEHRRAVVCHDREDALSALGSPERWITATGEAVRRPVAFLFPGQGAQSPGMARELYATEAVFRAEMDRCCEGLAPHLGLDLRDLLFPAEGEPAALTTTRLAQPALFVVEYALARLWIEWGIRPAAMIGHSLGEYVAACLAGVFSLEDALALVAERGRLMQELPPGAMLAVHLPEEEVLRRLAETSPQLSLAAVNAPAACSVSGPRDAVEALARRLAADGVEHRPLHTSHAFHSAMMEPALRPFAQRVAAVELRPPRLRFLSNVTGTWIRPSEAMDPGYWARHLREPVRFSDGLAALLAEPGVALLEVGPGRTLSTLARQHEAAAGVPVIRSLRHPREEAPDSEILLRALGRLWLAGAEPDWSSLHGGEPRHRVPLPTYPFERHRCWVERRRAPAAAGAPVVVLVPEGASLGPDWVSGLEAAGCRLVKVRPDGPEALARLLNDLGLAPGSPDEPEGPENGAPAPALAATGEPVSADPLELRLAEIWRDLLGIDRVGRGDDFFELGGSSLMATRLGSRIRAELGVELPVDALFAAPTVAQLAACLRDRGQGTAEPRRIEPAPRDGDPPLSLAQQQIWILQSLEPWSGAYNLHNAFHLEGEVDVPAVARSLRELATRHEVLRTTFPASGGPPVQRIAPQPRPALPFVDLSGLTGERRTHEARSLVERISLRPFDLAAEPPARTVLLRLAPREHVLCLVFHHIAFDGWSWGVLYGELAALYEAFRTGRPSPLPRLPIQYADFALWQRERLLGVALDAQLGYWTEKLAGVSPLGLAVGPGGPRSDAGAAEHFLLPPDLARELEALGRSEGCTLFMTLLAIFTALAHQRTGRQDVAVGSPVAGRTAIETEALIGNFVNTLVLRTDLSGDPGFRGLLARVRAMTLDARAHQDVPYEQVVAALRNEREGVSSQTPLFDVWFVVHDELRPSLALPGLSVGLVGTSRSAARHDLSLSLWPGRWGIRGTFAYRTARLAPAAVRRLSEDFTELARAVAAHPETRLKALAALLAETDRRQTQEQMQALKTTGLDKLRAVRRRRSEEPEPMVERGVEE